MDLLSVIVFLQVGWSYWPWCNRWSLYPCSFCGMNLGWRSLTVQFLTCCSVLKSQDGKRAGFFQFLGLSCWRWCHRCHGILDVVRLFPVNLSRTCPFVMQLKYRERALGLILVSPLCRAPSWTEWIYDKVWFGMVGFFDFESITQPHRLQCWSLFMIFIWGVTGHDKPALLLWNVKLCKGYSLATLL
jgi:hypothetical protein